MLLCVLYKKQAQQGIISFAAFFYLLVGSHWMSLSWAKINDKIIILNAVK